MGKQLIFINMKTFCVSLVTMAATAFAAAPSLGGEFTDPNHYVSGAGSFAGTRMISDNFAEKTTRRITLIGSDDGVNFWTLFGHWINPAEGKMEVDFSPKGGPSSLKGTFTSATDGSGKITWSDANVWNRAATPPTYI